VSVHDQRIIRPDVLDRYDAVYNLHPGLLPWGRGYYPVFWALWEGTPAGATLHEVVAALDAGPIIDQVEVDVRPDDTGGSLHARVQAAERALFERWWPRIVAGEALPGRPQDSGGGSAHALAEFLELKRSGWRALDERELERLERCLRFPGHGGVEGRGA
jgi:methionyl-tRNA formyltransferase